MTDSDLAPIVEAARNHYESVSADIVNAKDRIEHVRLTALAQGAFNLFKSLENLAAGSPAASFDETQEVLDLEEFKSPYNPRA